MVVLADYQMRDAPGLYNNEENSELSQSANDYAQRHVGEACWHTG